MSCGCDDCDMNFCYVVVDRRRTLHTHAHAMYVGSNVVMVQLSANPYRGIIER